MKKTLKGLRNLEELFTEQGMAGLDYLSMSIGYDGKAYFLFSSKIPDRIDGMFVNIYGIGCYPVLGERRTEEGGKDQFREACDELPFPPSRSRRFFPFVGLKMYVFEEKRSRKERGIY